MSSATPPPDPAAYLRELTAEAIWVRLNELEGEARALRVLLRSVRARERVTGRSVQKKTTPEAHHG